MLKYLPKDSLENLKKQCFIAKKLFILIKQQWTEEFTTDQVEPQMHKKQISLNSLIGKTHLSCHWKSVK